jgi:hypothetical protein
MASWRMSFSINPRSLPTMTTVGARDASAALIGRRALTTSAQIRKGERR